MSTPSDAKIIRDPAFGKRLSEVCEKNPNVPPPNYGRLAWFVEQLEKRFGEKVSNETVRKWLAGEVKPQPKRIQLLAELLAIDLSWLAYGVAPEISKREFRAMSTETNGAIQLVAGFVKMAGGHPAFPADGDKRSADELIDLYSIIRGVQYAMHISVAHEDAGIFHFAVPSKYESVMQVGVVPLSDFAVRLIDIPEEVISQLGRRKGSSIEVELTAEQVDLYEIKSLRQRL